MKYLCGLSPGTAAYSRVHVYLLVLQLFAWGWCEETAGPPAKCSSRLSSSRHTIDGCVDNGWLNGYDGWS